MLSSRVKISPLLWLHNKSRLSHQKTIKVKWFGSSLVFIVSSVEKIFHLIAALTHEIFFNTRREISYLRAAMSYPLYVIVNFLAEIIFVFLLFWGIVMYANEVVTKET